MAIIAYIGVVLAAASAFVITRAQVVVLQVPSAPPGLGIAVNFVGALIVIGVLILLARWATSRPKNRRGRRQ